MYIFTVTGFIISFLNLCLCIFILKRKWHDFLGRYLGLCILFASFWLGANALADISRSAVDVVLCSDIAVITGLFSISFYLCFIERYIDNKQISKIKLLFFFVPCLIIALLYFTKLGSSEVYFFSDKPAQITPPNLYYLALMFVLFWLIYGSVKLSKKFKVADSLGKIQIKLMAAGFILTIIGGITFDLIMPMLGELRFYNFGPQFSVFLIGFTSYAILRHRLLDFRIVIQKSLLYSATFAVFFCFYLFFFYVLGKVLNLIFLTPEVSSIVSAGLVIIFYSRLRLFFLKITDKFLYRYPYNPPSGFKRNKRKMQFQDRL